MTLEQLAAAGYEVDADTHARLTRFVELLLKENQRVNLTAIRDPAAVWPLHICDSLALRPLILAAGAATLLDLGSGGGVPGIPLAIAMPSLAVTLLDATRKKVEAIRRIAAALRLSEPDCPQTGSDRGDEAPIMRPRANRREDTPARTGGSVRRSDDAVPARVAAIWGRAETAAHDWSLRERFDGLTARGVAPLPVLLELAAGFVRVGGRCWLSKSCGIDDEIAAAGPAASTCGLALVGTHTYELPPPHGQRLIVEYAKIRTTPADLPRPPGVPERRRLR